MREVVVGPVASCDALTRAWASCIAGRSEPCCRPQPRRVTDSVVLGSVEGRLMPTRPHAGAPTPAGSRCCTRSRRLRSSSASAERSPTSSSSNPSRPADVKGFRRSRLAIACESRGRGWWSWRSPAGSPRHPNSSRTFTGCCGAITLHSGSWSDAADRSPPVQLRTAVCPRPPIDRRVGRGVRRRGVVAVQPSSSDCCRRSDALRSGGAAFLALDRTVRAATTSDTRSRRTLVT
jgi:hypothetical protein